MSSTSATWGPIPHVSESEHTLRECCNAVIVARAELLAARQTTDVDRQSAARYALSDAYRALKPRLAAARRRYDHRGWRFYLDVCGMVHVLRLAAHEIK